MCNGGPCKTKEESLTIIREFANSHPLMAEAEHAYNLDDFTTDKDKLMDIWSAINHWPTTCARIIFTNRPERYVVVTHDLANYACNKAVAMGCRLDGKIQAALGYEKTCEIIHKDLPTWAKW